MNRPAIVSGTSRDDEVGSLDVAVKLRGILSEAMTRARRAGHGDRWTISSEMSRLSDSDISKHMLDRYTSLSAEAWRFPAELVPAFCRATGDLSLLEALAAACGCAIASSSEARLAEIGAAYVKSQQLALRLSPEEVEALLHGGTP